MNNFNKSLRLVIISGLTFFMVSSCSKDEEKLFKDCILPWEELQRIPQVEIPNEIVDFTYKTYPSADTIYGAVIKFCNNKKRLYIQTESTADGDFLLYDSCGELIAKGKVVLDTEIRDILYNGVVKLLGSDARLYDSTIVFYENGEIEYIGEVYDNGESSLYLFDKNGQIICKLF